MPELNVPASVTWNTFRLAISFFCSKLVVATEIYDHTMTLKNTIINYLRIAVLYILSWINAFKVKLGKL
ncbi:hypothetical protein EB796_017039 [Bugula neritina]|uniref:Uncharacterized protein n=1 Tax=Bugula neritina TaxID=10212 RepID=A0A7J7JG92_BUGNE|nr:hypothetical protein EB796_017039 [Bugula neritina]